MGMHLFIYIENNHDHFHGILTAGNHFLSIKNTEFRHVSGFCPKSMHPVILFILSLKLKLFENHRKTISYKKYDLKPLSEYSKFQRN